jgi:hypothetical protein
MSTRPARMVYVMSDGPNRTKVGVTTNPEQRLRSLRVNRLSMVALVWCSEPRFDASLIEGEAHYALLPFRIRSEWFAVSADAALAAVRQAIAMADDGTAKRPRRLPDGRMFGTNGKLIRRLVSERG